MTTITKPDISIYKEALNYAKQLREQDNDPHALGHTMLYLAERNHKLDEVAKCAAAYIRFGQDQQLHRDLVQALNKFADYDAEAETMEEPRFGLD